MRADRLLSELLLLQTHRRMTARELAERLEVSQRTVLRDMDSLSSAGVPVMAERGAGGGWSLAGSYQTRLTGLNPAEAQSLFLAGPDRLLRDLGLHKAAEAALIKLIASLPEAARRDAEFARERLYVDVAGWRQSTEDVSQLATVQEAVWQGRMLAMTYRREGCESYEQNVAPLGLVAKGSVWYVVAIAGENTRSYRVSRIASARVLEETFERPVGFKLAEFWRKSAEEFRAQLPRYECTMRATRRAMIWIDYRKTRIVRRGSLEPDGRVEVDLRFDVEDEALQLALSLGVDVEVIQPPELRSKVLAAARELVAFYEA